MMAQLKEDKLEVDRKLIKIPPPTVIKKMEGTIENVDGNISNKQYLAMKELKSNSTQSKEFNLEITKQNTKGKEEEKIPNESTTKLSQSEDLLEELNNETMEKCSEIPSHLQGKLSIVKEVRLLKIQ